MKELINDIKTGSFRRVYLLYGPEDYLKFLWRDRLVSALIPDGNSMNLNVWSGASVSEGAVIDQAETLPFFSDRRVIRLDHTGFFERQTELLPDYIKSLPDYLTIVFTEDKPDKRGRLYKAVQKYGLCAEFAEQPEAVLEKWVLQLLSAGDLRIRKLDMAYFLERTGPDMTHIGLEADKLIHYCRGAGEVSREAIDAVTTDRTENRIFDMITAVTEHRQRDAMKLYSDLLSLREPPMRILYLIAMQYRRLLLVRELDSEGLGQARIAAAAGMQPFAVRKSLPLAKRYTAEQLKAASELCAVLEEDVKNGRIGDNLCVELLILKLSARGKPAEQTL